MLPGKPGDPSVSPTEDRSSTIHRKIRAAQDAYFQHLGKSWNEAQQELAAAQTEYCRTTERAAREQEAGGFQKAYTEYWRAFQETYAGVNPKKQADDAFRAYKAAVQKAMAEASVDELTFTDMGCLWQSIAVVSQYAWALEMWMSNPGWGWGSANNQQ